MSGGTFAVASSGPVLRNNGARACRIDHVRTVRGGYLRRDAVRVRETARSPPPSMRSANATGTVPSSEFVPVDGRLPADTTIACL